ncbi:MAG: thiamine-monophosphate kinase [Clostridia bacterium]|jgi:thiamine-monophosphate kinase|nr:thiamine-monophosphate kinase [Clostridia bacterium]MDN5323387.1 thiamine-monophosphate kinase [Clostridia bacterium]
MDLKNIGEFGLISRLSENCIINNDQVFTGIGDDAAVLPLDTENYLLAACDMLVEKVHFLTEKSTPFQIGYKSIAVNFSDIAAMGGWPTGILVSIGLPSSISLNYIEEIYLGMKQICHKYNVNIVGGDTVASPGGLVINVSVLGKVKKEHLHLRSQAQIGDVVFTTGTLGDSAAGLEILKNVNINVPYWIKAPLLNRHLCPEPCLKESKILNMKPGLNALNDISDGLASDVWEIATASKLGIELYAENIPLSPEVKELAKIINRDPLDWALYGGEDFELVGTICKKNFQELRNLFKINLNKELIPIGTVVQKPEVYLMKDTEKILLDKKGYNHFI